MATSRVPEPAAEPAARPSLYGQVRLARVWLPFAIVAVVLAHQLLVVPLGGPSWRFWAQLLFYSILGPIVTYVTLAWISNEVRERERSQEELQRTFAELQDSYAVLGALQRVTERFASAPDLEHAVAAATRGVREATGARSAAVVVTPGVVAADADAGDERWSVATMTADAVVRDRTLRESSKSEARADVGGCEIVSFSLRWGGKHEGSLHAVFDSAPDAKQRETLRILAADFAAAAEAVQARTRDLITLFEVDRGIRAEGNLDRLLRTLVTTMAVRLGADTAGVYLIDEDGTLELRAAVRRAGDDLVALPAALAIGAPVRVGEGPVGRAAMGVDPFVLPRLDADEQAVGGPLLVGAGSAVLLPLVAADAALGVIVLGHPDGGRFPEAGLPFLGVVANQVSLAVANANAYRRSEEHAIAEERARIAREVHDGIAQSLAFTALKLDLVARLQTRDPEAAIREVGEAKATIRELIREVRRSIFALRPVDLERYGFVETLRRYAVDFGQQNDIAVALEIEAVPELSVGCEAVLFRIFQEAMHNVAKHARASRVSVGVGLDEREHVRVVVRDDGLGFDPREVGDRVTSAGGLGLKQMRERVEARGGHFAITSEPGAGTTVRASVPA